MIDFLTQLMGRLHRIFQCFNRQPVGEPYIRNTMKSTYKDNDIIGVGTNDVITTHSLRRTVTTFLVKSGRPGTATSLRTGHICLESVRSPYWW